jgi:hypothetical protein
MTATPKKPDPNEHDELARLLPELAVQRDLPSGRQRQLEELVMAQIQQDHGTAEGAARRKRKPRLVFATSAVAAAAVAAVAIGIGGLRGPGPDGSTGPVPSTASAVSPAAKTFELAAVYAAAVPFTAPRPDQWIYIKSHNTATGAISQDKGQQSDVTNESWSLADGTKMAEYNPMRGGALDIWSQDNAYPALCALPTDPQALVDLLRADLQAQPMPADGASAPPRLAKANTPEDVDMLLFDRISGILGNNLLPPAVTAALWRAAALVPGVTQAAGTDNIEGRPVIAVGRIQDGWRFEQLLVDASTYEFVGYRSVAVKDHTTTSGPNGPITDKAGDAQYSITRVDAKIVDAAGQR